MSRTLIMSPVRIQKTFRRLAYEIIERNRGADNLLFFGIHDRGPRLAHRLVEQVEAVAGQRPPVYVLDVEAYRDDRDRIASAAVEAQPDVTDRTVILVDDVLFTGRTARAALDAIVRYGRPRFIQLVVLIDRGHREYPIQADYVGRVLPTKHKERVVVEVGENISVFVEE